VSCGRLKLPRLRLDPELYEQLRNQCYGETDGDANPAAQCQVLRSTIKNFVATPATIQNKT
jgi:hypothetical protein